ncbi:MAG: O-antigen ligase family protein [Candidatus Binatia bacterium]
MYEQLSSLANRATAAAIPVDRPRRSFGAQQVAWAILLTALTLTIVEGAIRKWLIGSAFQPSSYLAYFSKDIVFALLLFLPRQSHFSAPLEIFRRWLVPGCFLLICGVISSSLENISVAGTILTLRAALILPLLAFFIVSRLRGMPLSWVVCLLGIFTMVNFALGVYQNHLPASHALNRYATEAADIATSPTGVRATGTFSYITGLAVFSVVGVWSGMVCLSLARDLRQQIFGGAALVAGIACALASVSRGPILIAAIMLLVWLIFSGFWAGKKTRTIAAVIALFTIAVFLDLSAIFFNLGQELRLRAETSNDTVNERALAQFDEALEVLKLAPFGNGLGTEQVGRSAYSAGQLAQTTFESQLPRIILELGVLGLLGFMSIGAGAVAALPVAKRYCKSSDEKAALLATQLFLLSSLLSNIIFNHVASAFAWLIFTAVMAALPSERRE